METGPRLKVSSDRLVKPEIEPAIPGLQGKRFIHHTTVAPSFQRVVRNDRLCLWVVFATNFQINILFRKYILISILTRARIKCLLKVKDIYFVIYGIISDFTDKGQFQYLTNLKGPQEETYLYTTQFLSLR